MSSRRRFLSSTVAVAGSAGLPPGAEAAAPVPYFPLMRRGAYDYEAVMRVVTIQASNKLCFLSDATLNGLPGIPNIFEKMTNGWTAYEFGFLPSPERQSLAVSGVLIAGSIVFALNDAMWKKYRIGSVMKLAGRNGKIVNSNYSVQPTSKLDLGADPSDLRSVYHDYSSTALLRRGAQFLVCHNAVAGVLQRFVAASGLSHAYIIRDWAENLLRGFYVMPGAPAMVETLLQHGWHLYPVID